MPTAVPTMPDSASGLSMTRSSPKSFCSPSVIRKTPPSLPTSSPMTRTFGSSSIARRRPMLSPLASVILSLMSVRSLEGLEVRRELVALLAQLLGQLVVHHVEDVQRRRVRQRLAALPEPGPEVVGLGRDVGEELRVGEAVAPQVGLDARDRVLQLPGLH